MILCVVFHTLAGLQVSRHIFTDLVRTTLFLPLDDDIVSWLPPFDSKTTWVITNSHNLGAVSPTPSTIESVEKFAHLESLES